VLSDETIQVVTNNLDADKLRQVTVKAITLTLPASANTPAATTPINMVFFDRRASTSPSTMVQFTNELEATRAPAATTAESLLSQNLKNYGTSSLYLGLSLTPAECKQLFIDSTTGKPYDWTAYIQFACQAEAIILKDDPDNEDREKLFTLGLEFWEKLRAAGAPGNVIALLAAQGIRQSANVDVVAHLWWSLAMAHYANALAQNQPLTGLGKAVVKDGTMGFNEPWLVLATWLMLGQRPAVDSLFTSSLLKQAIGAVGP
jgi:hypothetical protein